MLEKTAPEAKDSRKSIGLDDTGLAALLELREFIATELDPAATENQTRSFRPLTDGLGLESPKPKPPSIPKRPIEESAALLEAKVKREAQRAHVEEAPIRRAAPPIGGLSELIEARPVPAPAPVPEPVSAVRPPPLPRATLIRRLMGAFVDELFVLGLFSGALLLTLRFLTGSTPAVSADATRAFENPLFVRFAILEFATIWLSYLAIGIGALDMTFGMWVWGLRISYGQAPNDEGRSLKKLLRILFTFFFFAPVVPLLLLTIRRRGRNLLDLVSGTSLYRAMV